MSFAVLAQTSQLPLTLCWELAQAVAGSLGGVSRDRAGRPVLACERLGARSVVPRYTDLDSRGRLSGRRGVRYGRTFAVQAR